MYHDMPRTQAEAYEQGVKYYFTDKECPHGHTSIRYTSNHVCVACDIERKAAKRLGGCSISTRDGEDCKVSRRLMRRPLAVRHDELTYEGGVCPVCSNTERYTKSRVCYHCRTRGPMTNHEVKLLIIRFPNKTVKWYANKARRKTQVIRNSQRAMNISPRNRPQHYVG